MVTRRACPRCAAPRDADLRAPCPRCRHVSTGARGSTRAWRRVRAAVLERDGHVCQVQLVCDGATATVVDHIRPVIEGGSDDPTNLRASCQPCNARRGRAVAELGTTTDAVGGW